ncbi:MAG: hypothetical protein IJZ18_02335 [Mailhella sp.]|nr:hypothetical protein [Mailhella sp.]
MKRLTAALLLGLSILAAPAYAAPAPQMEIGKAEFYLKEFEKEVARAQGADMGRYYNKNEALSRIQKLAMDYPDDPKVKDMVYRASMVLMKSKGDFMEITPDMTAYLRNEKEMQDRYRKLSQAKWKELLAEKQPVTKVFPTPEAEKCDPDDHFGKYVVLENVVYPNNQFYGSTGEFIHVGKRSTGFYFVELSGRNWVGPYEAVKRFRRFVDPSLGDTITFTVLGRITGVVMESPDANEEKLAPVEWGWIVEPEYLYAGERVVAYYDPQLENSGTFFGEEDVEKIKQSWYTVKSVPDNVGPKQLMEIFATAIKEKNYNLYKECINPVRYASDLGESLLRYHWDLHQARYHGEYVHAVFDEPKITVLKGHDDSSGNLENFFLDSNQREQLMQRAGEKEEMAIVMSRAFEQSGKQRGAKNFHELRRKGKGRWYINTYDVRF